MADVQPFEEWFAKLKRQAVELFDYTREAAENLDEKTWKEYYLDGFTPKDALKEHSGG
ncbi:MAG: hypothetical protein WC749_06095 [Dehalococcoidia bacterium]